MEFNVRKLLIILNKSCKNGNVDLIISSTDKNFMVPVGGNLIYSKDEKLIEKVKKNIQDEHQFRLC